MPLYEFNCPSCERRFEVRRTFSQGTTDVTCPICHGNTVNRVYTPISSFSKGSGGSVSAVGGSSSCGSCSATSCAGCSCGPH